MQAILFVCLGNICRSPTAEAVTRAKAPHLSLDSAGTAGYHIGKPPYGPMQDAAKTRGYAMSDLRARRVSADDFHHFDLIIAMDDENAADLEALRPAGATTPVQLFTEYASADGAPVPKDVPDPYYTRDFEGCLDLIEACAEGLISGGLTRRYSAPA
ncbi:MAG: low molecular weight protein-tyrosine-phosphatase [Pseudomonadota bacterium]